MLSKIWNFLKTLFTNSKRYEDDKNSLEVAQLPPVPNYDELLDKFDLYNKAQENGQNDVPAPNSRSDIVEQEITNYFSPIRNEAEKIYHTNMSVRSSSSQNDMSMLKQEISNCKSEYYNEAEKYMTDYHDMFQNNYETYVVDKQELENFKAKHNITRNAKYPDGFWSVYGFVMAFFVFEIVVNAFFFSKGSTMGLVGGIAECFFIAVINVGAGLLLGNVVRKIGYDKNTAIKICLFFISVALILIFNMLIVHYRELYVELGSEEAINLAFSTFIDKVISTKLDSIMFFIISCFCGGLAFYKGYYSDDPIPGYSKLDKNLKVRIDKFDFEKQRVSDEIHEINNDIQEKIERLRDRVKYTKHNKSSQTILATTQSMFIKRMGEIEKVYQKLIATYREENKKARSQDAPSFFNKEPMLPAYELGDYLNNNLNIISDEEYQNVIREIEDVLSSINGMQKGYREQINACSINMKQQGQVRND